MSRERMTNTKRSDEESLLESYIEPDTLPVFTVTHQGYTYTIAPRFNRGRLRWAVRVSEGELVRYENIRGLTDEIAEEVDIDESFKERINTARTFVHRNVGQLPVQGNRTLVEYPLSEVETLMEEHD